MAKPQLELGILQRLITYIDGFPRWGCFVACVLTAVQRSLGRELTKQEIIDWYNTCIEADYIKHNNLPIRKGSDWWRCFVVDRVAAFNTAMEMFQGKRWGYYPDDDHLANVRIFRKKTLFGWHFVYGDLLNVLHDPDHKVKTLYADGHRDMHIADLFK